MSGRINLDNMSEDFKSYIQGLDSQLEHNIKHTTGYINVCEFGVHTTDELGYENFDNKDAIMLALQYAKENKIAVIKFPSGIINTSPIKFEGFSQITLQGYTSSYYSDYQTLNGTTIKIINDGDYGLQFTYSDSSRSVSCTIENIKLDCNKKVLYGVNGHFDFNLNNFTVVNAKHHGIVLENFTYPAKFKNVYSNYNGKHGLYIKGGMTTVYVLNDCEFSRNDGYGIYIEGGASCSFNNIILQSNKTGGFKIHKRIYSVYLQNLYFNNIYCEANGTLETSDLNYEGNYALVIDNDTDSSISGVYFNGHAFNKSLNGKTMKLKGVNGIEFRQGQFNSDSIIDIDENVKKIYYDCPSSEVISNVMPQGNKKFYIDGFGFGFNSGIHMTRGRTDILSYKLATLSSWGTQYVYCDNTPYLLKNGSVLYFTFIKKIRKSGNGIIEVTPEYKAWGSDSYVPFTDSEGQQIVYKWDFSVHGGVFRKMIQLNTIKFDVGEIRLKIASKGHDDENDSNYFFNVMVEY